MRNQVDRNQRFIKIEGRRLGRTGGASQPLCAASGLVRGWAGEWARALAREHTPPALWRRHDDFDVLSIRLATCAVPRWPDGALTLDFAEQASRSDADFIGSRPCGRHPRLSGSRHVPSRCSNCAQFHQTRREPMRRPAAALMVRKDAGGEVLYAAHTYRIGDIVLDFAEVARRLERGRDTVQHPSGCHLSHLTLAMAPHSSDPNCRGHRPHVGRCSPTRLAIPSPSTIRKPRVDLGIRYSVAAARAAAVAASVNERRHEFRL